MRRDRRRDPAGGRVFGVTGPRARPPHRPRIVRSLVRSRALAIGGTSQWPRVGACSRSHRASRPASSSLTYRSTARSLTRIRNRWHFTVTPRGGVITESPGLAPGLLIAHAPSARSSPHARSHPTARRGWLPRLNQNVSRPVALLPGSSRPAASGARIVPWRQPGKWLIKCPFASTECLRASPTQCQCSKPPGRRCGLGSDRHGRSRSARWRTAGRAGPGREMSLGFEWGLGRGRGPAPVRPDSDSVGPVRSESHAFVGRDPVRLAALPALTLSARRAGDPAACEPKLGY